ncbi:MAG: hypothetical protein QOF53_2598 [Nocardioidaceae bacterium]|jgi:hypothetical protein|nr:hypothetical protein [Nocardioidaceae bacterium]
MNRPGASTTATRLTAVSPERQAFLLLRAVFTVALQPRFGAYLVAAWLLAIIVDLLTLGSYFDVALRDFGLLVAALALGRLAASPAPRSAETGGVAREPVVTR